MYNDAVNNEVIILILCQDFNIVSGGAREWKKLQRTEY